MTVHVPPGVCHHDSDGLGTLNLNRLPGLIDNLCLDDRFSIGGESRIAAGNRHSDVFAYRLRQSA
jgi:hypothetical protein